MTTRESTRIYHVLLPKITLLFACGKKKVCSSIKMSQNIMDIVVSKSNSFWVEKLSAQRSEPSAKVIQQLVETDVDSLRKWRIKITLGTLNINSMRSRFDQLKCLRQGKVDILVLTESKLNSSFPTNQFLILNVILSPLDLIETCKIYHARN